MLSRANYNRHRQSYRRVEVYHNIIFNVNSIIKYTAFSENIFEGMAASEITPKMGVKITEEEVWK